MKSGGGNFWCGSTFLFRKLAIRRVDLTAWTDRTKGLIITGHSDSCYYQMGAGKYEHKPTSGVCGRVSGFSTLVKPASSSVDPVNVLTMSLSGSFTCTKWERRVKLMDQHAMDMWHPQSWQSEVVIMEKRQHSLSVMYASNRQQNCKDWTELNLQDMTNSVINIPKVGVKLLE